MSANVRIIPVPGITEMPEVVDTDERAIRSEKRALLLLNCAAVLSVTLVSCGWVLLALEP